VARIEFQHVSKVFEGGVTALDDLSLTVEDGELLVLVGPSGCGKSTALRLVAGLERVTDGVILADGESLNELTPQERNVAVVFQNYALYPHKTVRQNLEFPLRMMKLPKKERRRKVDEAAGLLGLRSLLDRRPKELSGGQQQRVAMGRAIVRELQQRISTTTIYVTHDQVEAMTLGDRVGILRDGRLQQVAHSQEVYDRPANVFVATFIGSPRMNVLRARLEKTNAGEVCLRSGDHRWVVPRDDSHGADLESHIGEEVLAGLRPEAFQKAAGDQQDDVLEVTVVALEALGHERIVYADCDLDVLSDEALAGIRHERDQPVREENAGEKAPPLIVRLPTGGALNRGDRARFKANLKRLHLFDCAGNAIVLR
jgi:multiple sugar transport system ATP-binding protein